MKKLTIPDSDRDEYRKARGLADRYDHVYQEVIEPVKLREIIIDRLTDGLSQYSK